MRNYILQRRRSSVALSDITEENFDGSRRRSSIVANDVAAFRNDMERRRRSSVYLGPSGSKVHPAAARRPSICKEPEFMEYREMVESHNLPNGDMGKFRRMSIEIENMVADDSLKNFLVTAIFITMFLVSVIAFSIYQRLGT